MRRRRRRRAETDERGAPASSCEAVDLNPTVREARADPGAELVDVRSLELHAHASAVGVDRHHRSFVASRPELELHRPSPAVSGPRDPAHELGEELLHRDASPWNDLRARDLERRARRRGRGRELGDLPGRWIEGIERRRLPLSFPFIAELGTPVAARYRRRDRWMVGGFGAMALLRMRAHELRVRRLLAGAGDGTGEEMGEGSRWGRPAGSRARSTSRWTGRMRCVRGRRATPSGTREGGGGGVHDAPIGRDAPMVAYLLRGSARAESGYGRVPL